MSGYFLPGRPGIPGAPEFLGEGIGGQVFLRIGVLVTKPLPSSGIE
jgi:hypothetical protein